MKPDLIAALFQDIWCEGSVTIRKSKLLWLFGRQNDTASFWGMVTQEWNEFHGDVPLRGALWGDTYTLTCAEIENIQEHWVG